MTFISLITCSLIVFGLSFAAALTEGPFGLFSSFRKFVKSRSKHEWLRNGVSCPVCTSFWISAIVAAFFATSVSEWAALWLTSFGATCLVTSLSPD
jgi:hypothetical protein